MKGTWRQQQQKKQVQLFYLMEFGWKFVKTHASPSESIKVDDLFVISCPLQICKNRFPNRSLVSYPPTSQCGN